MDDNDTSATAAAVVSWAVEEPTRSGKIGNDGLTQNNAADTSAASGATTITPTDDSSRSNHQHNSIAIIENGDIPEDFGDLSAFVFVPRNDSRKDDHLARYDPEIDIPRPRTHSEVARHRVAKSAAGRRRAELESSEVGDETW